MEHSSIHVIDDWGTVVVAGVVVGAFAEVLGGGGEKGEKGSIIITAWGVCGVCGGVGWC